VGRRPARGPAGLGALIDVVAALRAAGCVFAEDEARLLTAAAASAGDLAAMVERRLAGQPLEHVLGWAEFCGLRIAVDPGVFVPRQRTAFLVAQATVVVVERATAVPPSPRVVVDLCCGSGAVGAALLAALGPGRGLDPVELYAVDIDPVAVRCARRNLAGTGAHVYHGDLYLPLPAALHGRVDLLVANAPYVPSAAVDLMPLEARLHEPLVALDGGADGLDVLRRVIAAAPRWLAPRGRLLVETSDAQAAALVGDVAAAGLTPAVAADPELGATVVTATRR
jgi:release factor glutamine methyltransferase